MSYPNVITPVGLLSFPSLLEPQPYMGDVHRRKFNACLLLEQARMAEDPLFSAFTETMKQYAISELGAEYVTADGKMVFRHEQLFAAASEPKFPMGDLPREDYIVIRASTGENFPPVVLDYNGQPLRRETDETGTLKWRNAAGEWLAERDVTYAGAFAAFQIQLYAYPAGEKYDKETGSTVRYKAGMSFTLQAVKLFEGGTPMFAGEDEGQKQDTAVQGFAAAGMMALPAPSSQPSVETPAAAPMPAQPLLPGSAAAPQGGNSPDAPPF